MWQSRALRRTWAVFSSSSGIPAYRAMTTTILSRPTQRCLVGSSMSNGNCRCAWCCCVPCTRHGLDHAQVTSYRASFTCNSQSRRWASGGGAGSGDEANKFKLHGKMVLQTARIALETRDADKLRGAKEVCAHFVEAYADVIRRMPAGEQREESAAQLGELRQALRNLIQAERGRFEVGVMDPGSQATDNILPDFRKD